MKKRFKNIIKVGVALTLAISLLAGCGSSSSDDKTIKIGASPSPHADILKQVKGELKKEGYSLEISEYTDYVQPNKALNDGDLDANFFQHKPYLDNFNKENKSDLISAAKIHFEPLGIYSEKYKSLDSLKDGDIVAVPNDATNEARALLLLEEEGVIKLKKGAGINATILDIKENKKNLEFKEIAAEQLTRSLPDTAIAVINGNYAISGGLSMSDALAIEKNTSVAAKTYANIIAVRKEDKDSAKVKALVKALKSEKVKKYIEKEYNGSVVPVF